MNIRNETIRNHYLAGVSWRLWSDFWANQPDHMIPPITFLRTGGNNEVFLATGATRTDVAAFVAQQSNNPDYLVRFTGDWLLDPYEWMGHWNCFFVQPRRSSVLQGRVELQLVRDADYLGG
jgi:hypothetical protein